MTSSSATAKSCRSGSTANCSSAAIPRNSPRSPTFYWNERGAHFIVRKTGEGRYRCQFFYSEAEPYGTGKDEYDNLDNCVLTLLQVQADHGRQLANVSSGATAANLNENDYHGPLVV